MKNTLLIFMMIATIISACAQKVDKSSIPTVVKTTFAQLHPDVSKVKWEKEDAVFEASFKVERAEQSIVFDADGKVIETETEIAITELPSKVKAYIVEKFQGAKIKEAAKITDAKGLVSYEAEVKGKDLIFDENGKLLQ